MRECITHHACDCLMRELEALRKVAKAAKDLYWTDDKDFNAVIGRQRLRDALAELEAVQQGKETV